ncbi:MAG: FMN-dependent NADH-azoreductase [Solirubrobacteraceae bacterium]|jgi:FMN-dependent NADH-azoreductase|nr:FMN-dependent NADH-azoreductase [Solirubrobacteraceae bacterium]
MTYHLLHIDSSIRGESSISRRLAARAAGRWLAANPAGTVTYRDLCAHPLRHLDADGGLARQSRLPSTRPPRQPRGHSASSSMTRSSGPTRSCLAAHLQLRGPQHDQGLGRSPHRSRTLDGPCDQGRASRWARTDCARLPRRWLRPGTPRDGWDHAEQWLPHALASTGLVLRFITAELTAANVNPALAPSSRLPPRASPRPSAPSTTSGT